MSPLKKISYVNVQPGWRQQVLRRCSSVIHAGLPALHTGRYVQQDKYYSLVFSLLREGRFPSCHFFRFWQNSLRYVCTIPVAKASRDTCGTFCSLNAISFKCKSTSAVEPLGRFFLQNFDLQKRSQKRREKYCQLLNKDTSPYFHSASNVVWPLTVLKKAIIASYPFLGLLLFALRISKPRNGQK